MTEQTSDTPRTDAVGRRHCADLPAPDYPSFARTLERELNEARADLEIARKNLDAVYLMAWHKRDDEVAALKDEIARLNAEAINHLRHIEAACAREACARDEIKRLEVFLSPPLSLHSEQIKTQPCETIND